MNAVAKDFALGLVTGCALVVIVVVLLALVGCADVAPKQVAVQVKTVDVPRAVAVPCVAPEDIPPKTPTAMPDATADAARLAAGAAADLHNLVAENDKLRALLIPCTMKGTP